MSKEEVEYTVSVRLMVYNHEKYIREALDGIFMQEVDFNVEIVVGDDFSTDRSKEIIASYPNTENIHIRILDRPVDGAYHTKRKEIGRLYNFTNIIENCNGKYVALLDGDDYWTDPEKLKIQVDIMEKHPEHSLVFHNAHILDERKSPPTRQLFRKSYPREVFTIDEILGTHMIHTATILVRNRKDFKFPSLYYHLKAGDLPFVGLMLQFGSARYVDRVMSIYRKNEVGITTNRDYWNFFENRMTILYFLNDYYKGKYKKQLVKERYFLLNRLFYDQLKSGDILSRLKETFLSVKRRVLS